MIKFDYKQCIQSNVKASSIMAQLATIREALVASTKECIQALVPFDTVFDEDNLEAHRNQLEMLEDEIASLQVQLIAIVCNPNLDKQFDSSTETPEYEATTEKLNLFSIRHKKAEDKVQSLLMEREIKYKLWKEKYIHNAQELSTLNNNLKRLDEIDIVLAKVKTMQSRPRHNLILMIQLHSQMNFLLTLAGIKRENIPMSSIKKALQHDLIDQSTYDAIMR